MSSTHFLVQQKIPRNKLSEQITNKIQNLGENPWILKLVNEVAINHILRQFYHKIQRYWSIEKSMGYDQWPRFLLIQKDITRAKLDTKWAKHTNPLTYLHNRYENGGKFIQDHIIDQSTLAYFFLTWLINLMNLWNSTRGHRN